MSDIVKDSSIWYNSGFFSTVNHSDAVIRMGIVKEMKVDGSTGDTRYLVEVRDKNNKIELNCRYLRRFGGVFNYEDFINRGYKINGPEDKTQDYSKKAGDIVLVAMIGGNQLEGVIVGALAHPARKITINPSDGPQYKSEFNGVQQSINKDGEYSLTVLGLQTNLSKLLEEPSKKLPAPEYDTSVGGAYLNFNKTGGITLSDASISNPQSLIVDKAGGKLNILSGKTSLIFTKSSETINMSSKVLDIKSENSFTAKTKAFSLDASTSVKIKSDKIAIGKEGVELLDQLSKLIDKLSMVQPISPIGPCTPLKATPQWAQIEQIKSKIDEIKGSL